MKKIVAAAVAVLLCATAFVGCTKNDDNNDNNNDAPKHTEHEYVYHALDNDNHKKSCKGCEDVDIKEAHAYTDNDDLICDLCGHTRDWLDTVSLQTKANLSADGYVKDNIGDFSQYVGTSAYRTVSTTDELIDAIKDAKYSYTNTWDDETQMYSQALNSEGKVHVIEITKDLNLG